MNKGGGQATSGLKKGRHPIFMFWAISEAMLHAQKKFANLSRILLKIALGRKMLKIKHNSS